MACLTVIDGPLKGQRVTLEKPITRIGRRDGNDWILQDGSVSGTHCEIEKTENGFILRDLGSTNGTKVNSELIKEKGLFRNDIVHMGEVPIMIEGDDITSSFDSQDPQSIPRTTIVIQQKRKPTAPPKEFGKKKSSNGLWIALITVLIIIIAILLWRLFSGDQSAISI